MKYKSVLVFFLILSFPTYSMPIVIDLDDAILINQGEGFIQHLWTLPGTEITQLAPGESYIIDIEFESGQSFYQDPFPTHPTLGAVEVISLGFGNANGLTVVDDPNLVLSSGTVRFTGVTGDLDVANPVNLAGASFYEIPETGVDGVNINLIEDITSDGFWFEDLHFEFTFADQGDVHPIFPEELITLSLFSVTRVPTPGTLALMCLGIFGLGWLMRSSKISGLN